MENFKIGLFDSLKKNISNKAKVIKTDYADKTIEHNISNQYTYVDSSSISPDEVPYYRPDNYYTLYSYPGTAMARRVITFEERKRISYPSTNGLYVPEAKLHFSPLDKKYELTELGETELEQNGYVPYMHESRLKTTDDERFGHVFNVWSINKLFPDGNAINWRHVVGNTEYKFFGVNNAEQLVEKPTNADNTKRNYKAERDDVRKYLLANKEFIDKSIMTPGDGFEEELKGMSLKCNGKDQEALVQFYIAAGKHFDAPAFYREAAILLRRYGMYNEELYIINCGIANVHVGNIHRDELIERREKVIKLIDKENAKSRSE